MNISAKGEYAIKAMLELALSDGEALRPIQDIAARQDIPQRYLEQVLLQLRRAGFLVSRRGSSGGYRLSRPPDQITVGSVLRVVEGSVAGVEPPRRARRGAPADTAGDLSELWRAMAEAVSAVIDRTTLADLKRRAEERQGTRRPMYHI